MKEVRMGRLPAIVMLSGVITLGTCAEAAWAKNARARHPAAHRSVAATGQPTPRQKPPVARTPTPHEKSWMDRPSAPSNSGGGGSM
jgi:hypothetical protein